MGQRLYAFNPRRADQQCSFEVLSRAPRDEEDEFRLSRRAERWSVGSVPAPMPLGKHETVTAYAVHPDGCTIFVSARSRSRLDGEREGGTHSFDTRSSVWTWHGEWQLPFQGEGCYVHELDAWVGLRRDGFLCSCAVPPRGGGTVVQPEWKLWKKTMFHEDPERHVGQPTGATLTYMGNTAGFALSNARAAQEFQWRRPRMVKWMAVCSTSPCSASSMTRGVTCRLRRTMHVRTLCLGNGPVFAAQTFWM
jgi:hypothetical protein